MKREKCLYFEVDYCHIKETHDFDCDGCKEYEEWEGLFEDTEILK